MRRLTDQDRRREQRRQSLLLDRLEARFRPRMTGEIERSMRELVDAYEATGEVGAVRDHDARVRRLFEDMATSSATVFGERIAEQGKALGLMRETKEDFAQLMRRIALRYVEQEAVRERITSITRTTRDQIVAQVRRGYEDGLGVAEIARMVSGNVAGISTWRGALIGRTETHGAANFGADQAARETGLEYRKEWVSASDERTRPTHVDADGQTIGKDDNFSIGAASMEFPGDPNGPPDESINCRCAVSHIVID